MREQDTRSDVETLEDCLLGELIGYIGCARPGKHTSIVTRVL